MSSPIPQQPFLKSGTYDKEVNSFSDFTNLSRFFATKKLRASLSSPPLAKDIGELEMVLDKTLLRVYFKVDGSLRYLQLT